MKLLINTLAVAIAAYIVPGIQLANIWTAVVLVVVLGILNFLVKPVLLLLTLPINILTLGLFTLVINTLMILLASSIVKGFTVSNFWFGFLFAIVLSLVTSFLYASTDN
jgi:putative membrane protein